MKPDKSQLKVSLRQIRDDLCRKEISCPDEKSLADYFDDRLAQQEMGRIRAHVALCDYCIERIRQIARGTEAAETPVSAEIIQEDWRRFENRIKKERSPRSRARLTWRLAAALVISLTATLAGGLYLSRPNTYPLATIDSDLELDRLNIFRGSDPLARGVFALKNKELKHASELFRNYVGDNPDVFDGHYYLGLTLLLEAESGMLAGFRFRQSYVTQAIKQLHAALSLLGDSPRQAANCFWFLGKAYLMQGEREMAEREFKKILALTEPNIKRKKDAQQVLRELDAL